MIRPLWLSDIPGLVALHRELFPDDLITAMGDDYLRRVFYPWYFLHPAGVGFGAFDDQGLAGYVVGSSDTAAFYSSMFRRSWRQHALCAAKLGLRRPAYISKMAAAGLFAGGQAKAPCNADLSYIAVRGAAQGAGWGRKLTHALLKELGQRKADGCWVKTHRDNKASRAFYESLGFKGCPENIGGAAQMLYAIAIPK